MRRRRLIWHLYPTYLLIVLIALGAAGWYFVRTLRAFQLENTRTDLHSRALLAGEQLRPYLLDPVSPDLEGLGRWVRRLGEQSGTWISVIGPSGKVVADSRKDPRVMDSQGDRAEFLGALEGGLAWDVRRSEILGDRAMFYGMALNDEQGRALAVLRVAVPLGALQAPLRAVYGRMVFSGLAIALLAALLSLWVTRQITVPLDILRRGAQRFARGDLTGAIHLEHCEEVNGLVEAMNRMAAQLNEKIGQITRHTNEQRAVFASMVEGVLAVDSEENLLSINEAALRMLEVDAERATGRPLREVVRDADMQRFVERVLKTREPLDTEIRLGGDEELLVAVQGTVLQDGSHNRIGALIVLHDVSEIRKLENMRRDFVANVSHELRTPITSIQGFTSTLLEGARHDPEETERFLRIIDRQAGRLNAIIEDLLSLSRIERDVESSEVDTRPHALRPILEGAIQGNLMLSQQQKVDVEMECPPDITAQVNPALLEESVSNLVNNALKHSPSGQRVHVRCDQARPGTVAIRVIDHGTGIAPDHIPRLFERFYRVDKARSRKLGGTGLGLAIVKHIVQAHGGQVEVESRLGSGSEFRILIPERRGPRPERPASGTAA